MIELGTVKPGRTLYSFAGTRWGCQCSFDRPSRTQTILNHGIPANVGEKRLKTVQPTLADCYSSGSIPLERIFIWIKAAAFNASPCFVLGALALVVGCFHASCIFSAVAAATRCFYSREISGKDGSFQSAVAFAKPIAVSSIVKYRPATDPKSSQVFDVVMEACVHD